MLVGVPREIKNHEYRVGLLPAGVRELVHHGHQVIVESDAGSAIGFDNDAYRQAGAEIIPTAREVFDRAAMVIKVKEPQAGELEMLHESQTLFAYLHLAPDLPQTKGLIQSGATCIAYETVTDARGRLPLLAHGSLGQSWQMSSTASWIRTHNPDRHRRLRHGQCPVSCERAR